MKLVRSLRATVLAAVMLALAACGGSSPRKPFNAQARLIATAQVNPNASGRPSPVHVRVFQLRDEVAFMNADFASLVSNEQTVLGASLVQSLEADLAPGDERELELNISPEARMLGVVAELANYRNAQWRVVTRAPAKRKERVLIRIDRDQTSIKVGK